MAKSMATPLKKIRKRDEVPGTFRILSGAHFGDGPEGCDCDACVDSGGKNHTYLPRKKDSPEDYSGDIIESKQDLVARYGSERFQRLHAHELV